MYVLQNASFPPKLPLICHISRTRSHTPDKAPSEDSKLSILHNSAQLLIALIKLKFTCGFFIGKVHVI